MTKYSTNHIDSRYQFGGVECGNQLVLHKAFTTLANGAPGDCNTTTQLQIGDVVNLVRLDAGTLLTDAQLIVSDAFGAGVTADIGFAYADGVDSTEVPQDADYFFAGADLAAAARLRTTTANAVVRLPKAAYLTLTVKGAAIAQVGKADVVIGGEWQGAA